MATGGGAEALVGRGVERERAGDVPGAIAALREARRLAPRDGAIAHRLGLVLLRSGNRGEAVTTLRAAIGLLPRDPGPAHDLGVALFSDGQFAEAARAFERSAALDPSRALHQIRLATARERLHDIPGALRALGLALSMEPSNPEAIALSVELLVREGKHAECAERAGALDLSRFPPHLAARVWNAQGRSLERLGDFDGAFAAIMRSNDTLRNTPEARAALASPVEGLMRETLAGATPEMFARWRDAAPESEPPMVWLVGMPRSGTTVMEQVLAMAPGVATNDERARASVVYEALFRMTGAEPRTVIERLDALSPEQVRELRALFHAEVVRSVGEATGAAVVIDKQPMRVMDAALIQRLLPRSKMIMMVRDPRDVCLSALFQAFNPRPVMSRFMAPDLAGRLCAEVMGFWRTVQPWVSFQTLEVRYEDLVRDFEPQTRRIAAFIGVPWTEAMHRFDDAARTRAVRSASYTAVTQGINDKSIGRWRSYRAHLGPVLAAVAPVVAAYGYDPD